ncbi:MAG: hypothetical protein ACTIC1_15550 [Brevibacterium sp.]
MRPRIHPLSAVGITAAIPPLITTAIFHCLNGGIESRSSHPGDADPADTGMFALGWLGFIITASIMLFEEDFSRTTPEAIRLHRGHQLDRFTGSVRSHWLTAFSFGPLTGILSAAAITTWCVAAESPGEPGTVWGDYLRSPLPALTVILSCWVVVTFCLAWKGIVDACSRTSKSTSVTVFVVSLVLSLLGNAALFAVILPILPPLPALLTLLPILLVALAAQLLTRRVARVRAALFGYTRPVPLGPSAPSAPEPGTPLRELLIEKLGANRHTSPFGLQGSTLPPYDLLEPGESLLMWLRSDRSPEPQMLIATDRRFVLASIIENGSSYILAQATPGKLLGGSSDYQGPDIVTSALFSDRPPMRILGGDPIASARFAAALDDLARTGKMLR